MYWYRLQIKWDYNNKNIGLLGWMHPNNLRPADCISDYSVYRNKEDAKLPVTSQNNSHTGIGRPLLGHDSVV
jgi:hypothetical protein